MFLFLLTFNTQSRTYRLLFPLFLSHFLCLSVCLSLSLYFALSLWQLFYRRRKMKSNLCITCWHELPSLESRKEKQNNLNCDRKKLLIIFFFQSFCRLSAFSVFLLHLTTMLTFKKCNFTKNQALDLSQNLNLVFPLSWSKRKKKVLGFVWVLVTPFFLICSKRGKSFGLRLRKLDRIMRSHAKRVSTKQKLYVRKKMFRN